MPIRLEAEALHHALARLEEWDGDAARDARASLAWFAWDEDGPLLLRRYDLLLHLWYELPTKVSASLEDKLIRAASLGRFLELTPAAEYAPLCRQPETLELIALWETSDARARRQFRRLLDASGMEPPDTPLLAWGSIMGLEEAQAREDVSYELELALEDGRLVLGAPGFKRRQAELVSAVLSREGRLEAVHAERLEGSRDDHRSPTRTAMLDRVAEMLDKPPDGEAPALASRLLERAIDGIALTQTGALNRALVREVAELRPQWWDAALFGPPSREDEIVPLGCLHDLLRDMRLLRRSGRRVVATARARALLGAPVELLDACARSLLAGDTFEAAVAELAAALIVSGEPVDSDRLKGPVHRAILEQGWHSGGEPPSVPAVAGTIGRLFWGLEALDLVEGSVRDGLRVTPSGRRALLIGLRARALGPRTRI